MSVHELSAGMPGVSEADWDAGYRKGLQDGRGAGAADDARLAAIEALLQQLLTEKADLARQLQRVSDQLVVHDLAVTADLQAGIDSLHRRAICAELESQSLKQDMATLEELLAQRSRQYVAQSWQFNRSRVFMRAARKVLEALLQGGGAEAERVRTLFVRLYAEQVRRALDKGLIKVAPETSPEFAEGMPSTRKFILDLLKPPAHK